MALTKCILPSPLNRAFRAKPRFRRNRPIPHGTQDPSGLIANICRSSILGDKWSQVRLFSRHSIKSCGAKSFVENSESDYSAVIPYVQGPQRHVSDDGEKGGVVVAFAGILSQGRLTTL